MEVGIEIDREMVLDIERIASLHQTNVHLCRSAMLAESEKDRKAACKAYSVCLLLKREIQSLYELLHCPLSMSKNVAAFFPADITVSTDTIERCLDEQLEATEAVYKRVMSVSEHDPEYRNMMNEHLYSLESLRRQLRSIK